MSLPFSLSAWKVSRPLPALQACFPKAMTTLIYYYRQKFPVSRCVLKVAAFGNREKEERERKSLCLRGRDDEDLKCGLTAVS